MMVRKLIFPILFITSVFAAASYSNYVQIDVSSAVYENPEGTNPIAGTLQFRNMNTSWNGMNIGLNNQENAFDTKIVKRKNFFGLTGKSLNFGINLANDDFFKAIKKMDILQSTFLLNKDFISFNGRDFKVDIDTIHLAFTGFNAYCQGGDGLDMTTTDGIGKGCLNGAQIDKNSSRGDNDEVPFKGVLRGKSFTMRSDLKSIDLGEDEFNIVASKSIIDIENYIVDIDDMDFRCQKHELDIASFEYDKVYKTCNNDLKLDAKQMLLKDKNEKTMFFFDIKKAAVADELINLRSPGTQIIDMDSSTTLFDMDIRCLKGQESDVLDLHEVISDCFRKGSAHFTHLVSQDEASATYKNYGSLASGGNSPLTRIERKNSSLNDAYFFFANHKMTFQGKVRIPVLGFVNVRVEGDVAHDLEEKVITLTVTKTKLPLGITSVNTLMKKLKKHLVNSFVTVKGNQVIIKL